MDSLLYLPGTVVDKNPNVVEVSMKDNYNNNIDTTKRTTKYADYFDKYGEQSYGCENLLSDKYDNPNKTKIVLNAYDDKDANTQCENLCFNNNTKDNKKCNRYDTMTVNSYTKPGVNCSYNPVLQQYHCSDKKVITPAVRYCYLYSNINNEYKSVRNAIGRNGCYIKNNYDQNIYNQFVQRITPTLIAGYQPDPSSTLAPQKMGTRDYGSNNWTVYTGKAAPINNNWRSGYYLSTKNLKYGAQSGGLNTGDVVTMIIDIGTWNFKTANIFLLANTLISTNTTKYNTINGTSGLFSNSPLILVGTDNIWDKVPKFDVNNLPPSNVSILSINPTSAPTVYKIVVTSQDVADKKRYITISHSNIIQSVLCDVIFDL